MNLLSAYFVAATRLVRRRWMVAPLAAVVFSALAACNGTALVTLTATGSTDTFLTYRVGLVSVGLQTSAGKATVQTLPSGTTVDLANLVNVSEVLGVAPVAKGNYKSVVVTVDYSSAEIVYDDGSSNGLVVKPVGLNGQAVGQVTLTLDLDPSASFSVASTGAARLALDFKLAASNVVNAAQKTVTVTPLIGASSSPIDTKTVRIRGPLASAVVANTSNTIGSFTTGVTPFDFSVAGAGQLGISPTNVTTYLINGVPYTGAAGVTELAALNTGTMTVTLGTLTSTTTSTTSTGTDTETDTSTGVDTDTTTTSSTDVSFSATQVLAGTSVQSPTLDRVSGIVSARSGNTLTIEDATLIGVDGSNTFLPGTATVLVGPATVVTVSGEGAPGLNTIAQISVGSMIYAFGTATTPISGNATVDASAGQVQLGVTTASGIVTVQGTGSLNLNLAYLGGRSVAGFDFAGTGASTNSSPTNYDVTTGALGLTNAIVGAPIVVSGLTASFGAAPPDFSASTLLDPTTIAAVLAVDYGAGTAAPFTTYTTTSITVNAQNASIGARHAIQVGAQNVNIVGLTTAPMIVPSTTASTMLFVIAHTVSGTVENFDTYDAFITQLQAELTGSLLVTGITASGQYTTSTYTFSASSITVTLSN
jgi:hypothetical protein